MSWRQQATEALSGAPVEGVERLRPVGPSLFRGDGGRALLTFFFSALAATLAVARSLIAPTVVDPFFMLLEVFSLGLALRAILLGLRLARRIGVAARRRDYDLALMNAGLILRTPEGDVSVAAEDLLDVRVGAPGTSLMGEGWDELQLVHRVEGRGALLRIPPVFGPAELVLARIEQRVGRAVAPEPFSIPAPEYLPTDLYDAVASGSEEPGVTPIRHGWGWMRGGPFAALLFGAVFLQGLLLLPPGYAPGPLSLGGVALCLLWPLLWLFSARRVVRPRRGLALLLSPSELIIRRRGGCVRAPYDGVSEVRIESRGGWSLLEGRKPRRFLVLVREADDDVRYAEDFLSLPAESVAAMILAYREGRLEA